MTVNKFQPQGKVKMVKGSILTPESGGLRFVLNFINMVGKTDNAIYKLFDKKWAAVKKDVKGLYSNKTGEYKLGKIAGTTAVQSDVWVINLLCQDKDLKTDLPNLQTCLKALCKLAKTEQASVHVSTVLTQEVPELPEMLKTELAENGVPISFYEETAK